MKTPILYYLIIKSLKPLASLVLSGIVSEGEHSDQPTTLYYNLFPKN